MDARKILGVGKNATLEEIRRAYLRKAAKYHPGHGGEAWAFHQIQEAYEQLTGNSPDGKSSHQDPASQAGGSSTKAGNKSEERDIRKSRVLRLSVRRHPAVLR